MNINVINKYKIISIESVWHSKLRRGTNENGSGIVSMVHVLRNGYMHIVHRLIKNLASKNRSVGWRLSANETASNVHRVETVDPWTWKAHQLILADTKSIHCWTFYPRLTFQTASILFTTWTSSDFFWESFSAIQVRNSWEVSFFA